jgi:hypothetical protein
MLLEVALSTAERSVSPARTPRPPLYVGIPCSRQISIEKYATVELIEASVIYRFLEGFKDLEHS